jgi:hypothetical protein
MTGLEVATGLISEVQGIIKKRFELIDPNHAVACAESLFGISTINVVERNRIGKQCIQPWTQTILPSGKDKTPPMLDLMQPTIRKLEGFLDYSRVLYLTRFTPEATFEMIAGKDVESKDDNGKKKTKKLLCDKGIIFEDEKSGVMKAMQNKQYMVDKSEELSKIWDGSAGRSWTRSHGFEKADWCNFGYIAASTLMIYPLFARSMFIQGHLARIDAVTAPIEDDGKPEEPLGDGFGSAGVSEMQELLDENETDYLAKKLYNVISSPIRVLRLDDAAEPLWLKYEVEMRQKAKKLGDGDLHTPYLRKNAQKALKRGACYKLSRLAFDCEDLSNANALQWIEKEDIELAIRNQREYTSMFNLMLLQWTEFSRATDVGKLNNDATLRTALEDAFKSEYDEILSQQKCAVVMGFNTDCEPVLTTLSSFLSEGKIVKIAEEESRKLIVEKLESEGETWCERKGVSSHPRRRPPTFYRWIGK